MKIHYWILKLFVKVYPKLFGRYFAEYKKVYYEEVDYEF